MQCAVCKKTFSEETSKVLPFCSERCQTIDLGRWLSEDYSLPAFVDPEESDHPEGFPRPESASEGE